MEKYIESENGCIYYWINKSSNDKSKCIVFTHGLTADHTMFEKQVEFFKDKYTVITWDIPLHGKSRPYKNFSYKNAANDLNSILVKENIDKVILVGMSLGGYPSQEFAVLYPDKVEGFVALDTTPFGLSYYSKSDLWWLSKAGKMASWMPDKILRYSMAKSVSVTKYSYLKMKEILSHSTKKEIVDQMDITYGSLIKENKDVKFNFPVLILVGDRDKSAKVMTYCKEWAKKTGYPLQFIKNARHFSNGDNAKDVNTEIDKFINSIIY